ncbi:MAG TPA: MarR family winged helix-turn-helix transcriptional regulator [Conexibacter sp.]
METAGPTVPADAPDPVPPGGADRLVGDLGWLLAQAHFSLGSEIAAAFSGLGVSPRGFRVLEAALSGRWRQSDLGEQLNIDKTTMGVTVDELERSGLAERRPAPDDRRARVIAVTPLGETKVTEGRAIVDRVQTAVLDSLPEPQRTAFLESLASLVRTRLAQPLAGCTPPVRQKEPRAQR